VWELGAQRTVGEAEALAAHELLVHHDDGHRSEDVERPRERVDRALAVILSHGA